MHNKSIKYISFILFFLLALFIFYQILQFGFIIYKIYYYKTHNPQITSLIKYQIKKAKKENKKYLYSFKYRSLHKISPTLKIAIIAAEDPNFFNHHGFDFTQIKESLLINLKHRKIMRGASTITMQTARTLFLNPQKTFRRKFKEAIITILLESMLSKKRIFELYLNYLELGNGIFGVEEASLHYFNKNNNQLTYSEILALTGAISSPNVSDPAHPNKWLLWKMRIVNNKYKLLPLKTKKLILSKY